MGKSVKRLYKQFQPEHYALELNLNPTNKTFVGRVKIEGKKVGPPASRLAFHQHGLVITAAAVIKHDKKGDHGIPVDRINLHNSYDEVRLHTKEKFYPGSYSLTMDFKGKIQDGMHGIYLSKYELDGKEETVISTQFESHHAREAFPGIDEPEAKATFALTLVTPWAESIISNMPVKSHIKEVGRSITTFETTPRMSTYLLAFVHGDLQHKETKTKDGVIVRVWSTKQHSPAALDYPLDVITKGIEFFNDYYGIPYPLPKSDNVAIPDFSAGAMENWGLITYREAILLIDPKTASQNNREAAALVSLHELSHQWFGNLVTMKWWDDLWLNESFANVMEYVATNYLFPEWQVWDTFISNEGLAAFRRDAIAGVQAIKATINHPDEISTIFDPSIVYAKGGRLLNMLMTYIGEEDFKIALKEYFTTHAYKNTVGDDLWSVLGKVSGKDVRNFMNPWLTRSGFPVVSVTQNSSMLHLKQTHFSFDPAKADASRHWPVPTLSTNIDLPLLFDTQTHKTKLSGSDYIRLNIGAVGHYIVNYTEPEHRAAIAKLVNTKELNEAERLMLLSDSSMLARAGIQSFAATLELMEHYGNEDSEPVWDIISLILADLRRFIDVKPELETKIKMLITKLITQQFDRLRWDQKRGETVQDTKLRATIISLGVYAEHTDITNHAFELFEKYKLDQTAIPAELRGIIFGAVVRNHVIGAFDYLLELEEKTSNVNLKQDLLGSLTVTKDSDESVILLKRLKDSKKVRLQEVDHWLIYLMRNRHTQEKAWSWLRANWDWIEKTFSGDKSYDYFPRYAASALNTRKRLQEYTEFFGPFKNHVVLGRNVKMGVEELTTRISWLERDVADIEKYFK